VGEIGGLWTFQSRSVYEFTHQFKDTTPGNSVFTAPRWCRVRGIACRQKAGLRTSAQA